MLKMCIYNRAKCVFLLLICSLSAFVDSMHFTTLYDSPCPSIFEYALDANNELYGKIAVRVRNPSAKVITLNVQFSVGNSLDGFNGKIQLGYERSKIVNDVFNNRPILYKVTFPIWRRYPPRITKIVLNGEQICAGPPLNIKAVPILTTVNLQHTLTINVGFGSSPASPDFTFEDTSFNVRPEQPSPGNTYEIHQEFPSGHDNQPNEYPTNQFFQPTTGRPNHEEPRPINPDQSFNSDPNQIITFVLPSSTTKGTTATPAVLQPTLDIDVRNDHLEEVCGKFLNTNYLISNGRTATRGHHPWLAALYTVKNLGLEFTCGGNLISTKHVVTAAHCLKRGGRTISTDDLLIILGKHNIQQWVDNESQMLNAKEITLHPDYKDPPDADIGMITLIAEVQFKKFIRPICLWSEPTDLDLIVGEKGIVAGWGKDENGILGSAEAKQVVLPVVSRDKCVNSQETLAEVVSPRTFCAGDRNGSGPCNGDSGGGFVMQRGAGRWTLRGLVSLSLFETTKVCDLSQYLVFTDVTKFSSWIRSFLNK